MRTRDKKRVPVKVKCSGCSVRTLVGDATLPVGTRIERGCKHCGATIRKIIAQSDLDAAIATYVEDKQFAARDAAGEVKSSTRVNHFPSAGRDRSLPVRETPTPRRKVRGDQVVGAAKLYHYAVYVRHPWGTDRIVVGVQDRKIQLARDAAWDRVVTKRKSGDLKILDAVPMRWTSEGFVETRKTRITTGNLKTVRRPKARTSQKQRKAPAYVARRRDGDAPKPAAKKRRTAKVEHVVVKTKDN